MDARGQCAAHEDFARMLGLAATDVLEGALWVDTGSEQLIMPLLGIGIGLYFFTLLD